MINLIPGAVDQSIDIFVASSASTAGAGLTGLAYNTSGLTCYYRRGATGTMTALTLATQTVGGAHADGGFVEIDATNAPGLYRLDLSDAIVASGEEYVTLYLRGATNMAPVVVRIYLEDKITVDDIVSDGNPLNATNGVLDEVGAVTGDVSGTVTGIVSLLNSTARSQLTGAITATDSPLAKIDALHQVLLNPKEADGTAGTLVIFLADGITPWIERAIDKTGDVVTTGILGTP